MRLFLVCGPWGGGTTAVTQLLQAMGGIVPGPHFLTYDPRTPDSLETLSFKALLEQYVDADAVVLKDEPIEEALKTYKAKLESEHQGGVVVLKHPLAAAALPQIRQIFDARVIFVMRSLDAIHATRLRRGWAAGSIESAKLIYDRMAAFIDGETGPFEVVDYAELTERPSPVARRLADFTGLPFSTDALQVVRGPAGIAEPRR